MPYDVRVVKRGGQGRKYQAIVKHSGQVLGEHPSMEAARRQIYAVEMAEKRRGKK